MLSGLKKISGLSRAVIYTMVERGELVAVRTENQGQMRIQIEADPELENLTKEVSKIDARLVKLSRHLGIKNEEDTEGIRYI